MNVRERFSSFVPWARYVIIGCVVILAYFLITSAFTGVKHAIFGNPEVKREQGAKIVAEEQTEAEAEIADSTINHIRERDVYREHTREIVREGQGRVNDAWDGETVGADVDAAGADTLCRVHNSLCRGAPAEGVQPVR
jgi:hypothetical protein